MRSPSPGSVSSAYVSLSQRRRIVVEPDYLMIEAQDSFHGYQPEQQVFWDEVRAVYIWESPDWGLVILGPLLSFVFLGLGMAIVAAVGLSTGLVALLVLATLIISAACVYRGLVSHRSRWMHLDTTQGPVRIPIRQVVIIQHILDRLPMDRPQP